MGNLVTSGWGISTGALWANCDVCHGACVCNLQWWACLNTSSSSQKMLYLFPFSLFHLLSNHFSLSVLSLLPVSPLLFPFSSSSSTSTPLSLPLPVKCLSSISITRSPLVWQDTMYSYWGRDCLETGSRLLNLTGSVCSSGCNAALRQ